MSENTSALLIENLCIGYPQKGGLKTAVDQLSLEIKPGEFFALLGPNGAGKTSIISAITGLVNFQAGKISVFGFPAASREAKFLVGLVPQELVSHGFFSVNEILQFTSGYYGIRNNQKQIDELLERLQLVAYRDKQVSHLSGGLKRRVLIAKALLHSPRILLLDEPSAGVDVELRTILWNFVRELNSAGTTIVLTTHYLEEAQRLCRRAAILDKGTLLALDETGSLIASMAERVVHLTLRNFRVPPTGKIHNPDLLFFSQDGDHVKVIVTGSVSINKVLQLLHIPLENVTDIRTEEGDLENAFLKLLKKGIAKSA